ncbi:MAG: cytoplasmic protein [Deltaproteobacteria bacterium]|nr:cytoplasmic protein [Deltaproteobacteria bacterium]
MPTGFRQKTDHTRMFKDFDATELYCPKCKQAVPVRKRLLLVLPEGDKYEYLCSFCSESVGSKIDRLTKPMSIIV